MDHKKGQGHQTKVADRNNQISELSCLYTNIDTMSNKKDEFECRIRQSDPDIIGITEINPKNSQHQLIDKDLQLAGYNSYFNTEGRGVALYIKDIHTSVEVEIKDKGVTAWSEVSLQGKDSVIIGVVYRSPNSTAEENEQVVKVIRQAVSIGASHVIILGDFNYPDIQWQSQTVNASSDHPSHEFMDCIQDTFL